MVPAIVVLEIERLWLKKGTQQHPLRWILTWIDQSPAFSIDPFARQHIDACLRLEDLPEIHDRMIASSTLVHDATLLTRDEVLRRHPLLKTAW